MKTLIGLVCVLTGSFLAIIGLLGAMGSTLTMKLLPGRRVLSIADLPERVAARAEKARDPQTLPDRVVVRGTAAAGPGGTFRAPLSDQECVWYLVTQTAGAGAQRSTVDRYPPAPFLLRDGEGRGVLVGPACPALEEITPSFRETRSEPHPWFDEAPRLAGADQVEVFEFLLPAGADVVAAGDLGAGSDGAPALRGEVMLSGGGDAAAAGDPARRTLPRDLGMAGAGIVLIVIGAVVLSFVGSGDFTDDPGGHPGFSTPQVLPAQ